ncbi:hypothetical protein DSM3645_06679 [Blastopirellula marina DSM 3645]|uniref:Uncharacterized protein n=1 Tax=Blastopirellula marina DSM 3645 TaxID=314230 RepID=A4A165_9BACT|nr:hypothetical protein DSM3645_06679 [Blastopirellula marina DSM 3645]
MRPSSAAATTAGWLGPQPVVESRETINKQMQRFRFVCIMHLEFVAKGGIKSVGRLVELFFILANCWRRPSENRKDGTVMVSIAAALME